ncbi:MAG: carboxylate--amine ligase [Hydrogenophaga sp.]|uniref:carboxylate--amine ligase n=1 Tax=Hydrogenophaga sp. TaxID=1904254 RepID=UPI002ABA8739|nr:carboxylate--amine ligase [Hydrogenophaga sp.]MDZ4104131.1 carboxylate--amine ligase [Hydrogenophaga sp.]
MRSRWGKARRVSTLEGPAFMNELQRAVASMGPRVLLFLTEEKTVNTVSELRASLPVSVLIRLPEHQRLMELMHKQGFQELAEAMAAPVPRTVRLQSSQDLPLVRGLNYPCVLKPSEKNYEYGARFKKAYKVGSAHEVDALYRKIEPVLADMVVQEWIEGADGDIYFCLQYIGGQGEVVSSFSGRKIRSWPPRIGGTASCTAAWEHAQELSDTTASFFRQVGFTGMGSMEYKRDARDGLFYMVEPTVGRTDFQEEVATVNGCNIPLAAYCHEMGQALPAMSPVSPQRVWRDEQADRWSREVSGEAVNAAALTGFPVVDAQWRWHDPLPWLDDISRRAADRIKSKFHK